MNVDNQGSCSDTAEIKWDLGFFWSLQTCHQWSSTNVQDHQVSAIIFSHKEKQVKGTSTSSYESLHKDMFNLALNLFTVTS